MPFDIIIVAYCCLFKSAILLPYAYHLTSRDSSTCFKAILLMHESRGNHHSNLVGLIISF